MAFLPQNFVEELARIAWEYLQAPNCDPTAPDLLSRTKRAVILMTEVTNCHTGRLCYPIMASSSEGDGETAIFELEIGRRNDSLGNVETKVLLTDDEAVRSSILKGNSKNSFVDC